MFSTSKAAPNPWIVPVAEDTDLTEVLKRWS